MIMEDPRIASYADETASFYDGQEPCPECGSKNYDFVMKDKHGYVVGCEQCLVHVSWYDYADEIRRMDE